MELANWTVLFTVALFMGLIVILILVFSQERKATDLLLAAYMGCMILFTVHNLLVEWEWLDRIPQLFRFPRSMMYVLGPVLYLYVRRLAYQEIRFRRYDFLFFLPAIIQTLLRIPYFLRPAEEKLELIQLYRVGDPRGFMYSEGMLPSFFHPILIMIWTVGFLFLSVRILISLRRQKNRFRDFQNRLQLRWLTLFVGVNILLYLLFINHWIFAKSMFQSFRYITIEIAFILLLISVALFFHPNILYGFKGTKPMLIPEPEKEPLQETEKESVVVSYVLSPERRSEILHQIRVMMEDRQAFLQKGYSIRHLGEDTGLPFNYLSQVINQEYGMNFNELINNHRIQYFKKMYSNPENRGFTLEALAEKAGFSSRATFARSFLRVEGITPREFVRKTDL